MKAAWWTLIVAVLLAGSGNWARAEEPARKTRIKHYGWQILGADAVALGAGAAAAQVDRFEVLAILWGLGAPAVHFAHGNRGRAALSLAGRVTIFALMVDEASRDEDADSSFDPDITPYLAAGAVLMLADALFAWTNCPRARAPTPVTRFEPQLRRLAAGGWALGLAGRF